MSEQIPVGTVVEVTDRGSNNFQYASVVEPTSGDIPPNAHETFVWVRYDNGCVVPKREYWVRALTADQVVAKLNAR